MMAANENARTTGEVALIDAAEAAAGDGRETAIQALRREGLPNRRVEAWHYTDLRQMIGRIGKGAAGSGEGAMLAPLLHGSHVVEIGAAQSGSMPEGTTLAPLTEAADWSTAPNHLDREIDTVRLINAAFGAPGVSIDVAADTQVATPIELRAATGQAAHAQARVAVGDRATATFVERIEGGSGTAPSSGVSHMTVGDGAEVLWIVDQAKSANASHLGQLNITLGADATLKVFMLHTGGELVRYEVHTLARGENSEIRMRGVNLIEAGQHIDVTTTLNHVAASVQATETLRNVVTGGHGVFQGMIKVARGAQKTDAKMACNTLLLSDEGDFSAKPELEIFADDVACGHGATAGEINAEHLFYLMSRGIPEPIARGLLIKAFVGEVVEELEAGEAVETALTARIDAWLARDH